MIRILLICIICLMGLMQCRIIDDNIVASVIRGDRPRPAPVQQSEVYLSL